MEQIEAATVYTVTSAADSGAGSLREAITLANGNSGLDTIQFSIGSGLQTINLFSALPQITDPVVIDGTTQPGFTGTPIIELNGGNAAVGTDGLRVSAGGTTIRGLVINRFEGNAILITSGGKNLIAGNYLGTDPTGTSDLGNAGRGILIMSSNDNTVGGTGGSDGNIISGNGEEGIKVEGTLGGHVTGTVIQGNFIGPDSTGAAALPNDGGGIYLRFASSSTVGGLTSAARNVISGNKGPQTNGKGSGIDIIGDDNTIQGNFIGPNAAGTDLLGDSQTIGVDLSSADRTTIGGTAPGARNVIAVALGTQGIITSAGVFLSTSSTDNAIEGNYIGVDVTGTALVGSGGIGVEHRGGINRVGGPMPGAGNVIGGFRTGISADDGLLVQGNLIGTNATGTAALPNNWGINASGQNVTIGGTVPGSANLISGNTGYGIIAQGANPVTIQGNQIGTNAAGTASLPNDIGVYLIGTGHVVGGTAAGAGNLISGNAKDGIQIDGSISGGAHDVVVQGNRIGTDVTGTAKISNGEAGIFIKAGPGSTVNNSGAFIGGTAAGAGNVISGNTIGVKISGEGATDHTIQGNLIGTAANGLDKLGNSSHGIWITASSSGNSIGGMDSGAANSIAYNGGDGIFIDSGTTNTVSRNSIYENAGLGIDLGPDGVTSNDLGDGDPGANNLLNFPVLTVANSSLGTTHFEGTLNSLSNSNFLLEFFLNDQGDPSGSGEGKTFLGSTTVMTNGMGDGTFSFDLSVVLSEGQWITATSTDPAGSTSEFSTAIAATIPPTIDTLTPADNSLGVAVDSLLTIDFSENIQKGTGNLVIRRSADDSLFESIPVSSAQVTIADDVVTIDPSSDLAVATEYYVEIDAGTFEDLDGNAFAGIADKTTWSFFSEDPSPTLSLSISPAAISEQGGKATGTVTRSSPAIVAVTVDLLSSDPTEASVPNAVVILAGQMSATFPITGIDDAVVDGTQTVTVTAGATGHTNGTDTVDVTDNDIPTLTVTIDKTSISENGGIATGTVTRNTDTTSPLTVTLVSSDAGEAMVPMSVDIPAGKTSATFTITGVSDNFVDGTETVTITASKSGFTNGFDTVNVINVDVPAIILSIDLASISENGGIATGTVTRNTDTTSPLTVTLMSSDTGEATVPMSVDILAGNASATFPITGVHDNIVDGTQTVTVTGSAAMLADGTDTVDIADIDVPTLTLTIDLASISEDGGTATGTVTRNTDTTNALTVMLISSDTGEAIVPMSVDIPAGKASATFPITGVNDNFVDGTETITITASAATFIDGTDTVDVTNVDVPTLTVTIDKGVISEGGDTATGTVSRNTDTTASLTVTLTSSDTGEAMVPMSVEIPAGKVSATFAITGVNDFFVDGVQTVIITASASDHLNGSETIDVADVDIPMLTLSINEDAISEDGGTATGNILRNTFPSNSLMVTLMSSDTGEASVPLFVEIPAGKTSAAFTITGVSDFFIDGTQTVTITASALSFADGTDTLDITDVSVPALMVTLDKSLISENGGMATGTVTRSTSTASTLTVTLASSDLTEASVPMTVVIPTGQASVTFPVAAVDDSFDDGDRSSVITASALGHDSGEASILIIDDDNSSAPDDILLFDETSGTFKLGTNTGTGFVWAQTGGLPSDAEFIGDFDGDGDLDAAYFNATTLNTNLVRNNGDGTFALPSLRGTISKGAPLDSFIGVADLEGDGTEEILYLRQHPVITENVQIWSKSLLPGGAEDFKISVAGGYTDFVIGDFNGDGRDDVVGLRPNLAGTQVNIIPLYSVNNGGNLSVLLSSGQFGTSQVFSPQAADLNHDGRDDLVVQRADGQVIHATSTGNSRPAIAGAHNFVATLRAPSLPEPSYPSGLLLGRFSDDTLVDLVAVDANGDILFAGTTLNPSFLNPVVISNSLDTWGTGPIGERYVVGDFNGDGYDDLAALGTNATIFFSSGDGSQFGAPLNFGPIIGGGAGQIVTVKTG